MKKIWLVLILCIPFLLFAQEDFSDGDGFSDSFSDDFSDDSTDSSFFSDSQEDSPSLEIGGSLSIPLGLQTFGNTELSDWSWGFTPLLETSLAYQAKKADLKAVIQTGIDQDTPWVNLDEAWVRLYLNKGDLELGYMKMTWGKGDQLHVMDILNPMDYSQFIEQDYQQRKQGELMLRLNIPTGNRGNLELVAIPWYTADSQAMDGIWMQNQTAVLAANSATVLEAYGSAYLSQLYQALYTSYYSQYYAGFIAAGDDAATAAAKAEAMASEQAQTQSILGSAQTMDSLESGLIHYENTRRLQYAQGGFRFTHSAGPLDWGVSLVRSFMDEPIISLQDMNPADYGTAAVLTAEPGIFISYTPVLMAAQEAGWVLGSLNFRQEAAFFMTEDWEGSDRAIRNPKVEWLFGFDSSLPVNHMNLNIQGTGSYKLFTQDLSPTDPDWAEQFYTHRIMAALSDSYFHETLKWSIAGSYNVEGKDFMILPEIKYSFKETLDFSAKYYFYQGDSDSLFGQFDRNDNLQLRLKMAF